jgi:hypothetical protein
VRQGKDRLVQRVLAGGLEAVPELVFGACLDVAVVIAVVITNVVVVVIVALLV